MRGFYFQQLSLQKYEWAWCHTIGGATKNTGLVDQHQTFFDFFRNFKNYIFEGFPKNFPCSATRKILSKTFENIVFEIYEKGFCLCQALKNFYSMNFKNVGCSEKLST